MIDDGDEKAEDADVAAAPERRHVPPAEAQDAEAADARAQAVAMERTVTIVTTDPRTGERKVKQFVAKDGASGKRRSRSPSSPPSPEGETPAIVAIAIVAATAIGAAIWWLRRRPAPAPAHAVTQTPAIPAAPTPRWEIH